MSPINSEPEAEIEVEENGDYIVTIEMTLPPDSDDSEGN